MEQKYLYLTLDLLSFLFPFSFSFYPKSNFSKKWKYLWPAILIPGILFILWDIQFTKMGVWGFNPRYLTGINFFNLPIEEVLFFICVPYACVFTYEATGFLIKKEIPEIVVKYFTYILVFYLLTSGLLNLSKWYTATTFITFSLYIILLNVLAKPTYLGKFYLAFLFILIPFFIVNGILTGSGIEQEVVWYNNEENLGIRMGTIPFEDTFYGMLLILMNISIFEVLQKRNKIDNNLPTHP
ncbi:MAG: lycopene cyclase domain-containing protein [Bacteroidia bacterium]|nr:lycopene cyclase domain-containing protein [Bacteroidia bacterium]